jgi:hypothetical protein
MHSNLLASVLSYLIDALEQQQDTYIRITHHHRHQPLSMNS